MIKCDLNTPSILKVTMIKGISNYLNKFLYIVADHKLKLAILVSLFLFTSVLDTFGIGLIGPFIALVNSPDTIQRNSWLAWVYDKIGLTSENTFISLFGLIIVSVFYAKSYLTYNVQRYVFRFTFNQKGELSKKLLKGYLAAPYTFHLNRNSALITQNIIQETNHFCNGIMQPLLNSISYLVIIAMLGLLLLITDLSATVLIIVILILPLIIYNRYKFQLAQWGKTASKAHLGIIKTINHSIGGLKETKVIGCESYFEDKISYYIHDFEEAVSASATFKLLPRIIIEATLITCLVGLTSLYLLTQQNTQNLTAVLGVFAIASIRLIPAATQLTNGLASLKNYSYTLNKLFYDLKQFEELRDESSRSRSTQAVKTTLTNPYIDERLVDTFQHTIELNKVTFSYPGSTEIALQDITLSVKKGESVALIGKSGAGKTTLVDVLLGLLEVNSGDIAIDGISIYKDIRSWQKLIGYIPQSIFLMDDTIKHNIAYGVPDHLIDLDKMSKAIEAAQLSELVSELPDKLNTEIGEKGVRLSGGQRQRIGIARALYHEREILILDEATAALDNETESLVSEAIQALSGEKTLIIIAHRLTTVEHCDRLYQLNKGTIVRVGTFEEVVGNTESV